MSTSRDAFDAFVEENKDHVAMPEDINFPLNADNLRAWVAHVSEAEDNLKAWAAEAAKIKDVPTRQATLFALEEYTHTELAEAFQRRATHVPYVEFVAAIDELSDEVHALCKEGGYAKGVLVLQDKALKSSTWIAQLMWEKVRDCVTDVVASVKEAVDISREVGDSGKVLIIHPDDASYSGTQIATAVAKAGAGLVPRVLEVDGGNILYLLAVPYVSKTAKDLVQAMLAEQLGQEKKPVDAHKLRQFVRFPDGPGAQARTEIMATIADTEDGIEEETMGFDTGLQGGQVPVYFDHKLADNVSAPTSIFSGAAYVEKGEERGEFHVRSLPLIEGCGENDPYRVHGRRRVPGLLVEDFDLGHTCPRAFYKTIHYTWGGRPIDPTKKIVPLLATPPDLGAEHLSAQLSHGLSIVPRDALMKARVALFGELSPTGAFAVRTSQFVHSAAQDFSLIFANMSVVLRQLAAAPLAPDAVYALVWAHQRRFIDAYFHDSELQVEFLVDPPDSLWLLRDSAPPARAVDASHYGKAQKAPKRVHDQMTAFVAEASDSHPLGSGPMDVRVGWSKGDPFESTRIDGNAVHPYIVQAEYSSGSIRRQESGAVVKHLGGSLRDVPRIAAGIDVLIGKIETGLRATPFLRGARSAFTISGNDTSVVGTLKDNVHTTRVGRAKPQAQNQGFFTLSETPFEDASELVGDYDLGTELTAAVHALMAANVATGYQHNEIGGMTTAFERRPDLGQSVDLVVRGTDGSTTRSRLAQIANEGGVPIWPAFRTSPRATNAKYTLEERTKEDEEYIESSPFVHKNVQYYGRGLLDDAKPMGVKEVAVIDPLRVAVGYELGGDAETVLLEEEGGDDAAPNRGVATDLYSTAARRLVDALDAHNTQFVVVMSQLLAGIKLPNGSTVHQHGVARFLFAAAILHYLMRREWPDVGLAEGAPTLRGWLLAKNGQARNMSNPQNLRLENLAGQFDNFRQGNGSFVALCTGLMSWDAGERLAFVRTGAAFALAPVGLFDEDDADVSRAYFLDFYTGPVAPAPKPPAPEPVVPAPEPEVCPLSEDPEPAEPATEPEACKKIKDVVVINVEDHSTYNAIVNVEGEPDANSLYVFGFDNTLATRPTEVFPGNANAEKKLRAAANKLGDHLVKLGTRDYYGPGNTAKLLELKGRVVVLTSRDADEVGRVLTGVGLDDVSVISSARTSKSIEIRKLLDVKAANIVHFIDSSESDRRDVEENVTVGANALYIYRVSLNGYILRNV